MVAVSRNLRGKAHDPFIFPMGGHHENEKYSLARLIAKMCRIVCKAARRVDLSTCIDGLPTHGTCADRALVISAKPAF